MEETVADFSRKELKIFLESLAKHVESGRVQLQIPGKPSTKLSTVPKQPIDVVFKEEDGNLTVKMIFEDRREA